MENILVLLDHGGYPSAKRGILAAASRSGMPTYIYTSKVAPHHSSASAVTVVDFKNPEELITRIFQLNLRHHVCGVATISEFAVESAALISSALGLPGLAPAVAKICRNKFLTRSRLRMLGIEQPRFELLRFGEPQPVLKDFPFPAILKPVNFAGSCCVMKVDSLEELNNVLQVNNEQLDSSPIYSFIDRSLSPYWLLEEYIDGIEMSIEIIVCDGNISILAIHDKMEPVDPPFFLETLFLTPSFRISTESKNNIIEYVNTIVEAIGFQNGVAHLEIKTNYNKIHLLEFNARLGGSFIGQSILHSTGINIFDAIVELALGRKQSFENIQQKPIAFYKFYVPAGRVVSVSGFDELRRQE